MMIGIKMKETMKTVRILMLAALSLSLFACQKETAEKESVLREKVAMTFDGNVDEDTKTSLEGLNIRWSSSDNITIFADGDANEFLVKKVAEGGKSATFQGYAAVTDTYYALSPVQEMASISGGVITARIDGEQTAVANSFGAEANVSIAQTGGSRLDFKNVGSLVSITLGDDADNDNITAIEITSKDGTPLAGQVNITYNEGVPELSTLNGSPTVRLSGDFEKGNTYYFVVLPGTHAGGLTLTFYKPGYKAVYNNSNSATFTRNKYRSFGKTPFNPQSSGKWSGSDFVVGTDMYIDGLGTETGQKGVYTAADGYWDYTEQSGGDATAFSDQTGNYNYEWFTKLTAGKKYWLRGGGHYFSVSADGNSVSEITGPSEAVGTVASTGVYRIRVNLPSGNAYVQKVTAAYYKHCWSTANNRELTYAGRGVWKRERMPIRRDCNDESHYDNRYKFYFTIGGNDQQYGTRHTTDSAPTKESGSTYWYLQPCVTNQWNSKFKLPSWLVDNDHDERYLADLVVYMNAEKAHYTHAFENEVDTQDLPGIDAGEKLTIQNSPEAGQSLAYVGSDDYWAPSINHSDSQLASYPYDYEIFTKLKAGQNFYFQNEAGNKFFALATGGTSWTALANASAASYSVASDGIYRIRINSDNKNAEIKIISNVEYSHNGVGTRSLTYTQRGTWGIQKMPIKRGSATWDDRYKFKFTFGDSSIQYYGRWSNTGGYPVYETMTKYGYVQPADNNEWEPGFKFPEAYKNITTDRIYCNLTLYMNNDEDHYTHAVTDIIDSENLPEFSVGDALYIGGEGAAEAGQAVSYISDSYYNTGELNAGDVDTFKDETYNYEIFTQLTGGKKIHFYGTNNVYFTLNEDGDTPTQSISPTDGDYLVPADGIYRIRLDLPSGAAYITTVDHVYYYYGNSNITEELTYLRKGVWQKKNLRIKWREFSSYDVTIAETRYHFKVVLGGTEQHFGRNKVKDDYNKSDRTALDDYFVQPSKVNTWDPGFNFPSTLKDDLYRDCYRTDLLLYLNNTNEGNHYTHEFANIESDKPSGAVTGYSVSGATETGEAIALYGYLASGTKASPVTSYSSGVYELIRIFNNGNVYVRDNNGTYYTRRSNGQIDANVTEQVYTSFNENGNIYDFVFDPSGTSSSETRIYGMVVWNQPYYWGAQDRDYMNMTYNGNGHWYARNTNWSTWSDSQGRNDDRFRMKMLTNSDYNSSSPKTTCSAGWEWGWIDGATHNAYLYRFDYGVDRYDCLAKPLDASGHESDNVLRDKDVTFWFHTEPFRFHIDINN